MSRGLREVLESEGIAVRTGASTDAIHWQEGRFHIDSLACDRFPEEEAVRADVITGFCRYVHFFSTEAAARPWLDKHTDAVLLPLAEAFDVGRTFNSRRYAR